MDNLEVDSIVFSVTYENYIKNIKQDKQNKTLGEWLIKDEMIDSLKYSYVYLVGSNQMIVKKYHIEKNEVAFLSSNTWDISGGGNFGYNCFWVNRNNDIFDNLDYSPKNELKNLNELLDII